RPAERSCGEGPGAYPDLGCAAALRTGPLSRHVGSGGVRRPDGRCRRSAARAERGKPAGCEHASPGGEGAAWLNGRESVAPEDIHEVFRVTVGHRVFLKPVYELRRAELIGQFLDRVLDRVAAP